MLERRPVNTALGLVPHETHPALQRQSEGVPQPWRRSVYWDAATGRRSVFLTNHFQLAAKTIADIYQERWQIEICLRFIKQNLRIKAVIGNSENAVRTQIDAALIAYLLLGYLKFVCNLSIIWQNCLRILLNLFRTCSVQELLEPPEMIAGNMCNSKQLTFAMS
jgi:hypothetical protein